jgi:hypothetical protein
LKAAKNAPIIRAPSGSGKPSVAIGRIRTKMLAVSVLLPTLAFPEEAEDSPHETHR